MTDQFYEKEGRDKLLAGAEKLYKAVKTTMGPRGRNVVIGKRGFGPTVTHDGVTVAKAVHVKDEGENVGAELIKEAADKLNSVAGDGTTTVTVLTYHILKAASELMDSDPTINPMVLAREVEAAAEGVIKYLEKHRLPADDLVTLQKIATISAGDEELGEIIAKTIFAVGATGTVTVEATGEAETTTEMVTGAVVERGYLSPYMITDENKMVAVYENPAVIILNRKIYSFREILPMLEDIAAKGVSSAVIIAEDVEGDALPSLVKNNLQGTFRTLCIKAPSFGSQQRQLLDDIAQATGATVIAADTIDILQARYEHTGRVKKVIASRDKTTLIDCGGDVKGRVDWLTARIEKAGTPEREMLEKRRAAIEGKVAVIHVGGQTETEIDEKRYRVDDAVAATKAATAEGILPGGGITLFEASRSLKFKTPGAKLLASVLEEPFRQLIQNSGMDVDAAIHDIVLVNSESKELRGFNVKTGEQVALLEAGIIDPYTVTRQAFATAVSLGVTGITLGAMIVDEDAK